MYAQYVYLPTYIRMHMATLLDSEDVELVCAAQLDGCTAIGPTVTAVRQWRSHEVYTDICTVCIIITYTYEYIVTYVLYMCVLYSYLGKNTVWNICLSMIFIT